MRINVIGLNKTSIIKLEYSSITTTITRVILPKEAQAILKQSTENGYIIPKDPLILYKMFLKKAKNRDIEVRQLLPTYNILDIIDCLEDMFPYPLYVDIHYDRSIYTLDIKDIHSVSINDKDYISIMKYNLLIAINNFVMTTNTNYFKESILAITANKSPSLHINEVIEALREGHQVVVENDIH